MREKKGLLFFTLFFWLFMIFFTLFSNNLHNCMLTKAEIYYPKMRMFYLKDGTDNEVRQKCYAIPAWMEDCDLFIAQTEEKNGQERIFARNIQVNLGEKEGLFCPIISNDYFGEPLILRSENVLSDGEEIYVKNWR